MAPTPHSPQPEPLDRHRRRPQASLSGLPEELLHHIASYLPPPALLRTARTSRTLHRIATSNPLWRPLTLSLPRTLPAAHELSLLPPTALSLSLAPDGWLRAFRALQHVLHAPWLSRDRLADGGDWLVYFRCGAEVDLRAWASRISFERGAAGADGDPVRSVAGARLPTRKWWVEEGVMRVPAYPDNRPCRDPLTGFKKFEHIGVMMVSDDPEFVEALVQVNWEVLREAVRRGVVTEEEAGERQRCLEEERRRRLPMGKDERIERLLAAIHRAYEERDAVWGGEGGQRLQMRDPPRAWAGLDVFQTLPDLSSDFRPQW